MKKVGPGVSKLSDRISQMVFIGYETGSKAYRMYNPESKKLVASRDAVFEEDRCWDWSLSGSVGSSDGSSFVVSYPEQIVCDGGEVAEDIAATADSPSRTPTIAAPQPSHRTRRANDGAAIPWT